MLKVNIVSHTINPDDTVAKAGKLCYSPIGIDDMVLKEGEAEKFVGMLANMHHESPLEHANFTVAIEGISRITEVQLVRHRLSTYSIQSGRYVKRYAPEFIVPPSIQDNDLARQEYDKVCLASRDAYNNIFLFLMLEKMGFSNDQLNCLAKDIGHREIMEWATEKIADFNYDNKKLYSKYEKECAEDARYAHLQSLGTKAVVTMNARNWLHFFEKRLCNRAQWEIRNLAEVILRELKEIAPCLFKYAGPGCAIGNCPEGSMSCGSPKKLLL